MSYGVGVAVGQLSLTVGALAVLGIVLMATPSHRCMTCGKRFSWEGRTNVDESPLPQDLIEERCPYCSSTEIHRLFHRRLKAATMFQLLTIFVIPLSLFPRYVCDNCGRKSY
jgi:DNA-directed RNA polymerase subunit RPC12/RpoP